MIGQLDSSIIVLPRWCPGTLDGPLPAVGTARLQALDGTGLSIGRHQDRTASIYHYNIYIYIYLVGFGQLLCLWGLL